MEWPLKSSKSNETSHASGSNTLYITTEAMTTAYHYNQMHILRNKIQKHFQNVMLVVMASEISENYTYKCVDPSRHNGIMGAKAKHAH